MIQNEDEIMEPKEVFNPDKATEYTFQMRQISKTSPLFGDFDTYDEWLSEEINSRTGGVIIHGLSKTGKTSLVERCFEASNEDPIWINGKEISEVNDFWSGVRAKLRIPATIHSSNSESTTLGTSFKKAVGGENVASFTNETSSSIGTSESLEESYSIDSVSEIRERLSVSKKAIVIDDFHHCPSGVAKDISTFLKAIVRTNLVVVVAIPAAAFDPFSATSENSGRFRMVEIPIWEERELASIGEKGFPRLSMGKEVSNPLSSALARVVCGSPAIMQEVCLKSARQFKRKMQSDQSQSSWFREFNDSIPHVLEQVAQDKKPTVFDELKYGKSGKGKKRLSFQLNNPPIEAIKDKVVDQYVLVLIALGRDPKNLGFTNDRNQIRDLRMLKLAETINCWGLCRVDKDTGIPSLRAEKLGADRIARTVEGMSDLAQKQREQSKDDKTDPVLSYMAPVHGSANATITVNDPIFLFYLRNVRWSDILQ